MARRDLTFRVFVTSTFSDLKAKRNTLQESAFPGLRAYYQEKGARLQSWDDSTTTVYLPCGQRIPVSEKASEVTSATNSDARLILCHSPCLELPYETWGEPRLLLECPLCRKRLKFNPFIVDNREGTG
jgi:hypothetical protein